MSLRQEVELGLDSNPGPEDTTQNGNMSLACFFPETISIPFPCLLHSGWSHCSGSTSGTLWGPRLPVTSLPPVHRWGSSALVRATFPHQEQRERPGSSQLRPGSCEVVAGPWAFSHTGCPRLSCCCFTCHRCPVPPSGLQAWEGRGPDWYRFALWESGPCGAGGEGVTMQTALPAESQFPAAPGLCASPCDLQAWHTVGALLPLPPGGPCP